MKRQYKNIVIALLVIFSFTSCDDFLNPPVYSSFDAEEFWQNEQQIRSYFFSFYNYCFTGYNAYSVGASSSYAGGQFLRRGDADDDFAYASLSDLSTSNIANASNDNWSFSRIRKLNYALESKGKWNLSNEADKLHWEGVARYFRAHLYANMVFTFGDVPYYDHTVDAANKEELYKDRDPRVNVDEKIMEDLQFAMNNCRENDGYTMVNKYVVAAMASRFMLREGTFLKYHKDLETVEGVKKGAKGYEAESKVCLEFAKKASEMVMNSGKYSLGSDYNLLFTSEDLSTNPEIIMARAYQAGTWTHATLSWCYNWGQNNDPGCSNSLAEAFLGDNGLPIATDPSDPAFRKNCADFFAHRDPRLSLTICPYGYRMMEDTTVDGKPNYAPYSYNASGYSYCKFMDYRLAKSYTELVTDDKFTNNWNITHAPCVRLGEVLINYAEIEYELDELTQTVLDKTVNALRDRPGIGMPHLTVSGEDALCEGVTINDPKRLALENAATNSGYTCSPILWEIRRERRVELAFEGTRMNDLKRWKKFDYIWDGCNPDICRGPYIVDADYDGDFSKRLHDQPEGYYDVNMDAKQHRNRPEARDYLEAIPTNQITLYKNEGYTLTQNPGWVNQ